MKHKIPLPKTELQQIKDLCNAQGFDYADTPKEAECDSSGNIIEIKLPTITKQESGWTQEKFNRKLNNQAKLKIILKSKGIE